MPRAIKGKSKKKDNKSSKIKNREKKKLTKKTTKKTRQKTTRKKSPKTEFHKKLGVEKFSGNPIISPKGENFWESNQTFNPGAVLIDDEVHFIYRAVGNDGISRFGKAKSRNGLIVNERVNFPVYQHQLIRDLYTSSFRVQRFPSSNISSGGSFGGCEDPRIVRVGDENKIYMTYTAWDRGLRMAITSIKVKDFISGRWNWDMPRLISPPGEVHKNWVIFPEKIKGKYAILHSVNPEILVTYVDSLEFTGYLKSYHDGEVKSEDFWEDRMRGAGPPPLKTNEGWLLFYHAIEKKDPGKYKLGAMLLDLKDPSKILYRSPGPILEPDKDYENSGFKPGVVYATGSVIKDDVVYIYYGAADSYVCVAYIGLKELMEILKR